MHSKLSSVRLPDKNHFQPRKRLFRRKDPLWQRIYRDIFDMMGPTALPIQTCYFGSINSCHEEVNLYYQTEEAALFLVQFDFVILAELRKYFPSIKEFRL